MRWLLPLVTAVTKVLEFVTVWNSPEARTQRQRDFLNRRLHDLGNERAALLAESAPSEADRARMVAVLDDLERVRDALADLDRQS